MQLKSILANLRVQNLKAFHMLWPLLVNLLAHVRKPSNLLVHAFLQLPMLVAILLGYWVDGWSAYFLAVLTLAFVVSINLTVANSCLHLDLMGEDHYKAGLHVFLMGPSVIMSIVAMFQAVDRVEPIDNAGSLLKVLIMMFYGGLFGAASLHATYQALNRPRLMRGQAENN